MFKIISKKKLAVGTFEIKVFAPKIARKGKPGQFVIIRIDEKGERIPLTIADYNDKEITLVFMVVGHSTEELSRIDEGGFVMDVVGPLGNPSEIMNLGTVVMVGGGCGVAPIYHQAKSFKKAGNKVISIIGFRSKDLIFWEDKMKEVTDELLITTDDGSYGKKGYAADALKDVLLKNKVDRVVIIGPPIMMKHTSEVSKNIPTVVSINSIMVDGIGMCGACRVNVGGKTKFSCVDGPEFYALEVDFDELVNRNKTYSEEEKELNKNHEVCYG